MKAFSFFTEKDITQIGVEYQDDFYNFSLAWELYKQLKNKGQGPELNFLQVMVEADFLQVETLQEVLFELKQVRPLDDLKLKQPVRFLPPIGRPQKILCIGRNYKSHAKELNNPVPEEPIFFSKSPSSIIGHEDSIQLPPKVGRVDYEGEVAIVIGKQGKNIAKSAASDFIAGYTLLNDVTARDLQKEDQQAGKPWYRSKSFDTFCPVGPFLVPADTVEDYQAFELNVFLNGKRKQSASLSDMLFGIDELVSYLSNYCTLVPGDIIATGTPAGVGQLEPGDEVEVVVGELGHLRNSVN